MGTDLDVGERESQISASKSKGKIYLYGTFTIFYLYHRLRSVYLVDDDQMISLRHALDQQRRMA